VWVRRLRLHEFRNHAESLVELVDGPVVIAGPNGAGKTSILEAVSVLATGHSFRTSDDSVLLRAGASRGIVEADVVVDERDLRLGVAFGAVDRRFFLNGVAQRTFRDIAALKVVVFSPDDLRLCKGSPAERRDFVDGALAASSPAGMALLADWSRVLKQRNVLLKSLRPNRADTIPTALETWTAMLADKGAELVAARVRLLAKMRPHIESAVADLAGLEMDIAYVASFGTGHPVGEATEPETIRARLAETMAERIREEIERGVTLVGPHRDDISLKISQRDVRSQASQGEQRVVALALRLGELGLLEEILDDSPVLLLDDVFSELDPDRRSCLLKRLPKAQTLMTTTGAADAVGPPPEMVSALEAAGLVDSGGPAFVAVAGAKVVS